MAENEPLDVLGVIEAQTAIADVLDGMKRQLTDRGWAEPMAESAALTVMGPILLSAIPRGL